MDALLYGCIYMDALKYIPTEISSLTGLWNGIILF